jgi:tRNA threonylcarbamoyladenosine biosynthesis protein TsaB
MSKNQERPMIILAFELANFGCSVALWQDGEILAQHQSTDVQGQDVTLISHLKSMLNSRGLRFQDLNRIVTTTGPGSFTGIRVALATAQGLSLAAQVPAVGISSFGAVSSFFWQPHTLSQDFLVLLESRRLELYGQLFEGKTGAAKGMPFALSPADIRTQYPPEIVTYVGTGAIHLDIPEPFTTNATHLAALCTQIPPEEMKHYPCLPLYMRPADTSIPKAKTL